MANLNKVMIIGRTGTPPEMKYTPNGAAVTTFAVAVNNSYKGKDGNKVEETEWFNVVAWNQQAEFVNQYIDKGRLVYVEGKMKTRSWVDDNGGKHYRTELIANQVQALDRAPEGQGGGAANYGDDDEEGLNF
jgi:single-strand DNA-binding protein